MRRRGEEEAGPSRSARKRSAQAVEELARRLAELPEAQLRQAPLGDELRTELQQVRAIRSLAARDRQIRHLAGCLRRREEELSTLEEFLAGHHRQQLQERQQFHRLEQWRDALCHPATFSAALEEVTGRLADLDPRALTRLARAAQGGDRRAFREIFRLLRQAADRTC